MITTKKRKKFIIGWREWVSLPELGIHCIKAKVDTGARTSALHAFALETYKSARKTKIRFLIHPIQRNSAVVVKCSAEVIDFRWVSDSGGHREQRYVIQTPICMGDMSWPIELTLTNRDSMVFRMLLGRTAMHGKFVVDPRHSFLTTKE